MLKQNIIRIKLYNLRCVSIAALVISAPLFVESNVSFAQIALTPTPQAKPDSTTIGFDEIVVTARRRSENLQKVPIAVTVYSSASLEARSVSNISGLAGFAPNVELNSGNPNGGSTALQAFIRGVGQSDYLFPNDPGVGLYVDNVYISRTVGGLLDLADIQQLEILRGPQGVLYGKNTIGGAINVSTRLPDGKTSGAFEAITGSFKRTDVKGYVAFPISDTLSGKVSAAYIHRDGYGRQVLTGRQLGNDNRFVANSALRWQPSTGFDFVLRGDFTRTDQAGQAGTLGRLYAFDVPLEGLYKNVLVPILNTQLGLPAGSQLDNRYISANRYDSYGTAPSFDKSSIWGVSLNAKFDLNADVTLKSITAYRHLKAEIARDTDHTPYTLVSTNTRDKQRQLSQEFQLAGTAIEKRLNWLFGLYYLKEHAEDFNTVGILSGTLPVFGFELDLTPQNTIDVTSTASFAHASFALTDKLSLSGGLRWSRDQKTYKQLHFRTITKAIVVDRTLEKAWSAVTYKGSIDYKPTEDALVYASVSRGFKSGGWSPRPNSAADGQTPFSPEFLLTYELGAKTQWFDRRLIVNAALFSSSYSDIQLSVLQPSGNSLSINVLNAGKARLRGFEVETIARPFKGFDLSATLSHLSAKYTKLDAGVTDVNLTTPLREAPPWSATLGAQYRFELGSAGSLSLRGDATYKGRVLKDFGPTEKIFAESYKLYSARLTYATSNDKIEVALFGTNLSDARYISNAQQVSAFGYDEVYYGRPREWGLSAKYKF